MRTVLSLCLMLAAGQAVAGGYDPGGKTPTDPVLLHYNAQQPHPIAPALPEGNGREMLVRATNNG
jgi:hypothetical protein